MNRRTLLAGLMLASPSYISPFHSNDSTQATPPIHIWTELERQLLIDGLQRTKELVIKEAADLTNEQWNFRESTERWSIAEIVEHLGLQEDMYFREIYLISQVPAMPELIDKVKGKDKNIGNYSRHFETSCYSANQL